MKRTLIFAAAAFLFFTTQAQDYPLKNGAKIVSQENIVNVVNDQTIVLELAIIRSKEERRTRFEAPIIQNIEGLEYAVKKTEAPDSYLLILDPSNLVNGSYSLIIKGSGQFKRYLTSTMVTLNVSKETPLMVNNH